jgi:hypothetical protein
MKTNVGAQLRSHRGASQWPTALSRPAQLLFYNFADDRLQPRPFLRRRISWAGDGYETMTGRRHETGAQILALHRLLGDNDLIEFPPDDLR